MFDLKFLNERYFLIPFLAKQMFVYFLEIICFVEMQGLCSCKTCYVNQRIRYFRPELMSTSNVLINTYVVLFLLI